jgi:hypothetical protein
MLYIPILYNIDGFVKLISKYGFVKDFNIFKFN